MGRQSWGLFLIAAVLAGPCLGSAEEPQSESAPATSDATPPSPPDDPNESLRLMFAPTGRPLGKGNGYFSDHYVLFPGVGYGLTKNLSVGAGISTLPAVGLTDQIFYVTASSGFRLGGDSAIAMGGFLAGARANEIADFGVAALYGIGTLGPPDRSLSLGIAAVATQEEEYVSSRGAST